MFCHEKKKKWKENLKMTVRKMKHMVDGERRKKTSEENPNLHPGNCRSIKTNLYRVGFPLREKRGELGQLTRHNFLFSLGKFSVVYGLLSPHLAIFT